jgi:hypothetical protein
LPKIKAIKYEAKDLPIDPYTLGVLIGDGSLTQQTRITTADEEILLHIPYETRKLKGKYEYSVIGINDKIRDLHLNVKSEAKHIPEQYLLSSV